MNIVFLNQYYPPDAAPTGMVLQAVAEELQSRGHDVTILASKGGYANACSENANPKNRGLSEKDYSGASGATHNVGGSAIRVIRVGATSFGRGSVLGKLVDYMSFYLGVCWSLMTLERRPDRVVAMTTPPFLSILARCFSKIRDADHAHWVMDLYPDVMIAHGMFSKGGVKYAALKSLACWGFGGGRCGPVLSIGPDMSTRLKPYLQSDADSPWVPLWGGGSESMPDRECIISLRAERGWTDDEHIVMYSGNMGLGHLFDEILEIASEECDLESQSIELEAVDQKPNFRFVFFGEGKRRIEIEKFIEQNKDPALELHGYVDHSNLKTHLASADVHLVSLSPEWDGTMVPSKLQGIFAVARPVIFIGSEGCAIGKWILESGGGWVVEPQNPRALKKAMILASDKEECNKRGKLAHQYMLRHFDKATNACKVADILTDHRA